VTASTLHGHNRHALDRGYAHYVDAEFDAFFTSPGGRRLLERYQDTTHRHLRSASITTHLDPYSIVNYQVDDHPCPEGVEGTCMKVYSHFKVTIEGIAYPKLISTPLAEKTQENAVTMNDYIKIYNPGTSIYVVGPSEPRQPPQSPVASIPEAPSASPPVETPVKLPDNNATDAPDTPTVSPGLSTAAPTLSLEDSTPAPTSSLGDSTPAPTSSLEDSTPAPTSSLGDSTPAPTAADAGPDVVPEEEPSTNDEPETTPAPTPTPTPRPTPGEEESTSSNNPPPEGSDAAPEPQTNEGEDGGDSIPIQVPIEPEPFLFEPDPGNEEQSNDENTSVQLSNEGGGDGVMSNPAYTTGIAAAVSVVAVLVVVAAGIVIVRRRKECDTDDDYDARGAKLVVDEQVATGSSTGGSGGESGSDSGRSGASRSYDLNLHNLRDSIDPAMVSTTRSARSARYHRDLERVASARTTRSARYSRTSTSRWEEM